jgi:hypothetical protein
MVLVQTICSMDTNIQILENECSCSNKMPRRKQIACEGIKLLGSENHESNAVQHIESLSVLLCASDILHFMTREHSK